MAVAKPKPSNEKLKAKNISTKTVNLTHGSIEPGKAGTATAAEISTLYKHLERVSTTTQLKTKGLVR